MISSPRSRQGSPGGFGEPRLEGGLDAKGLLEAVLADFELEILETIRWNTGATATGTG